MTTRAPYLSLVVPIHHCAGTLTVLRRELDEFLERAPEPVEVVLVDDHGTHPDAAKELAGLANRLHARLLRNDRNRGKGYSVTRGMLAATGAHRVFTDADLAYPLEEVWKIVAALERGADVAIACRVHPESVYTMSARYVRYIYTRHVLSRMFNAIVRITLIPDVLDTQAGLKGYTAAAARDVFSRTSIAGFGFDLECLFVARALGLHVEQVAVRYRYHDEPTTVRFLRDAKTMAADLARIRWRGWFGEYARPRVPVGATRAITLAQHPLTSGSGALASAPAEQQVSA
jgi:dolichyl-phosphate beta-glucosyltransferase